MWNDRFVSYYSPQMAYAIRWLKPGCSDDDCVEIAEFRGQGAGFMEFAEKVDAERFYNKLMTRYPRWRIEAFFSQTKWIRYFANADSSGERRTTPIGESQECQAGHHSECQADACTCAHHIAVAPSMDSN